MKRTVTFPLVFTRTNLYGFQNHRFMEGDNDGDGGGDSDGNGVGDGGGEGDGNSSGGGVIPDELKPVVDKIVQKRLAREKKQNAELATKLKALQSSSSLTQQERDDLASQIETLETSMQTEQERSQGEQKRLQKKYESDTKALTDERDTWRSRFESTEVRRALTDAAVSAGAENPSQIALMFGGNAKLVQDQADGKPVESFTPMLSFTGLGEDGKTQETLELPIAEAIAKIKADGLNANLFKHSSKPGTGTPPSGGSGGNGADVSSDPNNPPVPGDFSTTQEWQKAYDKWRKDHKHSSVKNGFGN